ncbi:SURF1 family protein [Aliiglaciecola sp. CAU 1673]|uniref:SURF1 family protein n=1 Tax=Aliiglaciecola sp. CAU 1673 TaxID=3032595 RepID=UPI0023D9A9B3|nr:SURF1 family protein [Aliiglaciecola sp. CAU 1673]MDF2179254.1 SURF1 family protein [Aliiglaciecola sp. CAU 1673]
MQSIHNRYPLLPTLIVIFAVGVLLRLGWWQLERAEQKQLRAEQLAARQGQPALDLQDINRMQGDVRDFPLQVTGSIDTDRPLLWDNRIMNGQVGYEVLALLRTEQGNLAVNLGWVPAESRRELLPQIVLPAEKKVFEGVVTIPSDNPLVREMLDNNQSWPLRLQQPDIALMEKLWNEPLMPFMMQLGDTQSLGLENNWRPVVMPAQKHLAYALQWFGLAVACLLIYVLALRKRNGEK